MKSIEMNGRKYILINIDIKRLRYELILRERERERERERDFVCYYGSSTFVDYLMPKLSLLKNRNSVA